MGVRATERSGPTELTWREARRSQRRGAIGLDFELSFRPQDLDPRHLLAEPSSGCAKPVSPAALRGRGAGQPQTLSTPLCASASLRFKSFFWLRLCTDIWANSVWLRGFSERWRWHIPECFNHGFQDFTDLRSASTSRSLPT